MNALSDIKSKIEKNKEEKKGTSSSKCHCIICRKEF